MSWIVSTLLCPRSSPLRGRPRSPLCCSPHPSSCCSCPPVCCSHLLYCFPRTPCSGPFPLCCTVALLLPLCRCKTSRSVGFFHLSYMVSEKKLLHLFIFISVHPQFNCSLGKMLLLWCSMALKWVVYTIKKICLKILKAEMLTILSGFYNSQT